MKIRTCFVSNSSSSSCICDLCGRSETGWDLSLLDAEMVEYINGHTICQDEMMEEYDDMSGASIETKTEQVMKWIEYNSNDNDRPAIYYKIKCGEASKDDIEEAFEYWSERYSDGWEYEMEEKYCPICQMIEFANSDLADYLEKRTDATREEAFAEVKKLNKRRKKLYDNEYVMYACQKSGIAMEDLVTEIKEKFSTYAAFSEYFRGE